MEVLTIQLKRLGKKKVKQLPLILETTPKILKELLEACVRNQVDAFNKKREEVNVVGFLRPVEIQDPTILAQINSCYLNNKGVPHFGGAGFCCKASCYRTPGFSRQSLTQ